MARYRGACRQDPGASYSSASLHSLARSTLDAYGQSLSRILRIAQQLQSSNPSTAPAGQHHNPASSHTSQSSSAPHCPDSTPNPAAYFNPDLNPGPDPRSQAPPITARQALDATLLHLVRSNYSGSYGRHAVSAVRLLEGSPLEGMRWHAFRRFGAAQLFASGLRLSLLQIYGGWASSREAARYAHPDTAWTYQARGSAPTPHIAGTTARALREPWVSSSLWSPWVRREIQASNHRPLEPPDEGSRKRARSLEDNASDSD